MLHREFIPSGAFVLKQGMFGDNAYMIESGKIEVFMRCPDGEEIFLAELGPGTFVGEIAAMFGGKRCASARAREDSVLITVSGQDLRESARMMGSMDNYITDLIVERVNDIRMKLLKKAERQTKQ